MLYGNFNQLFAQAQCVGNVVNNGSFISAEGEAVTAPGWTGSSTPDVNDAVGALNTTPGYVWDGIPVPSSDGGTWQNMFSKGEYVQQNVTVTPGKWYTLKFEYTAQGIKASGISFNGPVGVIIYLDGNPVDTTPNDNSQFTWESYCYTFQATKGSYFFKLSASQYQYVAVDGVCLTSATTTNVHFDTIPCSVATLTLNVASPNATYLWHDGSTDSTYVVSNSGISWVTVNDNACGARTDTFYVFRLNDALCEDCTVFLPNALTANGDNLNDEFFPEYNCTFLNYKLMIFDRWGDLIFQTSDANAKWNGRANGGADLAQQDVYVWVMQYTNTLNEERQLVGHVSLIR